MYSDKTYIKGLKGKMGSIE